MNRKWTGTTNQTLKAHIDRHITSFFAMTEASNHVSHQIPDDCTRVGYLIASIESADTNVVAALSSIRMDDTGRRENFETALVFLAQICPMVSNKGAAKPAAKIGAAVAQPNSGVGTTGVELRYHTPAEYKLLTQVQRDEVSEYNRTKNPNWKGKGKVKGKGKGKGSPSTKCGRNEGSPPSEKNIKTMISSALAELVKYSS